MARIETDPNYTTPTFPRATAGPDIFKKEDVQQLAAAVSTHDHTSGKGLRITTASFTGSVDLADWYRTTGHSTAFPSTGTGGEFYYDPAGGYAVVQGYNRLNSTYVPLRLFGATVNVGPASQSTAWDASGNISAPQNLTVGGNVTAANVTTNGALYVAAGGARIDTPGGDMIRLVNSAQTVLDFSVGRSLLDAQQLSLVQGQNLVWTDTNSRHASVSRVSY